EAAQQVRRECAEWHRGKQRVEEHAEPPAQPGADRGAATYRNYAAPSHARSFLARRRDRSTITVTTGSANELIDVVRTEAHRTVVRAAHLYFREHILVADLPPFIIEIDHRPADIEESDHFRAIVGHDECVDLARRLVNETAFARDPVVLEVTPLAPNHIADDNHRVTMPAQHARLAHPEQ